MYDLKSEIPPGNPFANIPYWSSPEGHNGSATSAIEYAIAYIKTMDKELPCSENKDAIWHLNMALKTQKDRHIRRVRQGVVGTNVPHEFEILDKLDDVA